MKKVLMLLLFSALSFGQNISPNPGAPDFLQGGHLAPAIGSAGHTNPCQVIPYEAWYSPMPSSNFVLMKMGPCSWGIDQFGSYTTAAPLHIQSVHCWIGTSANARFETVSSLQIWTKDSGGTWHMMFDQLCEFDKHQDVVGNTDKMWTYPTTIDIPAGSIINAYRYPGGLMFCGADPDPLAADAAVPAPSGWNFCATEIHWRVYGTGK